MYTPSPAKLNVELPADLLELSEMIAKNVHEVWAQSRIEEGWTYRPVRDDTKRQTPCLVPYEDLPESEKAYDRNTAMETIKLIISLGYDVVKRDAIVDVALIEI